MGPKDGRQRRRNFIKGIVAAAPWPWAARAQQPAMPVVGILSARSLDTDTPLLGIFRRGLDETGYVEGQNVRFDYRFANGQYDRLRTLAAGLANSGVAVIVAIAGSRALPAAKDATSTIPIIFGMAGDPVKLGFVTSLSHPGGNITGVTMSFTEAAPKQLGLIVKLLPGREDDCHSCQSSLRTRRRDQGNRRSSPRDRTGHHCLGGEYGCRTR